MSQHLTDAQLDQIEQMAREATPGPWELIGGGEYVLGPNVIVAHEDSGVSVRDAPYIATMDPATALQMIDEVKTLRAQVAAVRELHQAMRAYWGDEVETVCSACFNWLGDYIPHPCPTIRALDGES